MSDELKVAGGDNMLILDSGPEHLESGSLGKTSKNKLAKLIVLPSALICTDKH